MELHYVYHQAFFENGKRVAGGIMFTPFNSEDTGILPSPEGNYARTMRYGSPRELGIHLRDVIIRDGHAFGVNWSLPLNLRFDSPPLMPHKSESSIPLPNGKWREVGYEVEELSDLEKKDFWRAIAGCNKRGY